MENELLQLLADATNQTRQQVIDQLVMQEYNRASGQGMAAAARELFVDVLLDKITLPSQSFLPPLNTPNNGPCNPR